MKSRPESPCIAICSTTFDEKCKGCGRTYVEVAQWNGMTPEEKEAIWQRIDAEGAWWRYNRYADRVKPA